MIAHEIMIKHVFKVKNADSVKAVIEKFIEHRISGLPVVNDRNEIVAYVSDGDIMRYIDKHEDRVIDSFYYVFVMKGDEDEFEGRMQKLLNLPVMEIAKKRVVTVQWDTDIEEIAAILGKKQIKKLPVERNGVLAGIISRGDVIRHSFQSLL
jgi:CBS domain-containing protein